ncbi:hypothetical protein P152DRAFT_517941 [Eremomyces bilateralis CBS 781.70]|uniref:CCHC-type domain-containing protein n=1 Tax=Eremomyces bilateralis CBS 781.70 TaxID=1392243 RepID=A0A6G1FQJ3_9PEZI|nr:uncharacterized protein P152DRAFT_517941 [Eremomyces bilateralis CBS 781.70]KAF1807922.1 hypothetical protein P152DRAFT_517941 [Eremomyces bilateralis CBS 781.70]
MVINENQSNTLNWDGTIKRVDRFDRSYQIKRYFKCYQYGHIGPQCRNPLTCGKCAALNGHKTEDYTAPEDAIKCVLCKGPHVAWSSTCRFYKDESLRARKAREMIKINRFWPEAPIAIIPGPSEILSQPRSPPQSAITPETASLSQAPPIAVQILSPDPDDDQFMRDRDQIAG